jgi:hypothetical protein
VLAVMHAAAFAGGWSSPLWRPLVRGTGSLCNTTRLALRRLRRVCVCPTDSLATRAATRLSLCRSPCLLPNVPYALLMYSTVHLHTQVDMSKTSTRHWVRKAETHKKFSLTVVSSDERVAVLVLQLSIHVLLCQSMHVQSRVPSEAQCVRAREARKLQGLLRSSALGCNGAPSLLSHATCSTSSHAPLFVPWRCSCSRPSRPGCHGSPLRCSASQARGGP